MKNFLYKIYAFKFFDDLILIYPLYTVMFKSYGMQPWQIAVLLSVWSFTAFLLEVPSGVWADKYSRKNILFIGQITRLFGYLIWLLFPNFTGFLVGFVFWGIKSALTSGTFQALIYDELKSSGLENDYVKVLGRTKTISFIAIFIASIFASGVVGFGYQLVLIFSLISVFISACVVFAIPNAEKVESTYEKEYFVLLKRGLSDVFKNPNIFRLVLFLSLAFALGGALDEYWTLFANEIGLPDYGLGIFLAIVSICQALASFFAYRLEKKSDNFFYILFSLCGVLLCIASYIFSLPALILLIIFSFVFTIIQLVFDGKLQSVVDSSVRATVSSVSGFFIEIGVIFVYFCFGFLAQIVDYRGSFIVFGLLIMIIGCFYLFFSSLKKDMG